jgi:hypothetical protein
MTSPYTNKARMILLEKSQNKVGTWQDEEVKIMEDYQRAFGTKPTAHARIAVMNDSDNTRESSVSYLEYIVIFK